GTLRGTPTRTACAIAFIRSRTRRPSLGPGGASRWSRNEAEPDAKAQDTLTGFRMSAIAPEPIDAEDLDGESEKVHPRDVWAIARFLGPFARPYRGSLLVLAGILLVETLINA